MWVKLPRFWIKFSSITLRIKATEQYFPAVLFMMLCKEFPTFESVDEILKCGQSKETYRAELSSGTVYQLYKVAMTFEFVGELLNCDFLDGSYRVVLSYGAVSVCYTALNIFVNKSLLTFMMKRPDGVGIGPLSLVSKIGGNPLRIVDVIIIQVHDELWYVVPRSFLWVRASLQAQFTQEGPFRCFKKFRTFDVRGTIHI